MPQADAGIAAQPDGGTVTGTADAGVPGSPDAGVAPGATVWERALDGGYAVRGDGSGNIYVLAEIEVEYTDKPWEQYPEVLKFDSAGNKVADWKPNLKCRPLGFAVGVDGTVAFSGIAQTSDPSSPGRVVKLSSDGSVLWSVDTSRDQVGLSISPDGSVVYGGLYGDEMIVKLSPTGSELWRVPVEGGAAALTTDGSNNIIVAGMSLGGDVLLGNDSTAAPANTPYLMKLNPNGGLTWIQFLRGASGQFDQVGVSNAGTVVAKAGLTGTFSWNGAQVSPNGAQTIVVAEASGAPRWAKVTPVPTNQNGLAVDPLGQVLIDGWDMSTGSLTVIRYNLAGDWLWSRTLPQWMATSAAALPNHEMVLLTQDHPNAPGETDSSRMMKLAP